VSLGASSNNNPSDVVIAAFLAEGSGITRENQPVFDY
jgi:hypothetical protein